MWGHPFEISHDTLRKYKGRISVVLAPYVCAIGVIVCNHVKVLRWGMDFLTSEGFRCQIGVLESSNVYVIVNPYEH